MMPRVATKTPRITAEQLVLIAQELAEVYPIRIINFAALCAAAAAASARIDGIAVHANPAAAATALRHQLQAVPALSGANREFAQLCAAVYLKRASAGEGP